MKQPLGAILALLGLGITTLGGASTAGAAAAGNPRIADELQKGKKIGDPTYKVHLDGYDKMDLLSGKGPSKRHEIFYFAETTLGAVPIDDYKYRFIDQPNGWLGGTVKLAWRSSTCGSIPSSERVWPGR